MNTHLKLVTCTVSHNFKKKGRKDTKMSQKQKEMASTKKRVISIYKRVIGGCLHTEIIQNTEIST